MRIMFFTNEYDHPKLPVSGGLGSFLKIMSEELTKKGHEIHIYGFSKRSIEFEDKGIRFGFFKKYSKQFPFKEFVRSISSKLKIQNADLRFLKSERMFYAKKIKTYCEEHNIDIIESSVFNGYTAYWDNSFPLVLRFHGSRGFWHHYLGKSNKKSKIAMEQRALENTPYTVTNSYFSENFIKNYYDVHVDKIIRNGIDTKVFSPNTSINIIPKSIFYVGTMSESKGLKDLIEIFNKVIENEPEASLHLIGRGESYWNYLRSEVLTEKALINTRYYSHMTLSKVSEKLAEASIIAVPSKGETFGFTIVESMAIEKVTVVSNIPVAEEIITNGEDGFIAQNNDDFESIILKVLENPEAYDQLRKNARQKVLDNFTFKKMTTDSLAYYKTILNNHY